MKPDGEQEFLRNIKKELDVLERNIDATTLQRLRRVRAHSLDTISAPRPAAPIWLLPAAVGLAAVAVIAITVTVFFTTSSFPPAVDIEDMELLTTQDNLDFYADIEFYRWLAGANDAV